LRMERMSMIDASFLYMENEFDLHHNAWLGIFAGAGAHGRGVPTPYRVEAAAHPALPPARAVRAA
jgi:hypothetical protein